MAKLHFTSSAFSEKNPIGKEVDEVQWQAGIGEFSVRLDNFTIIPWLLPHWYGEKNKRMQEIKGWNPSQTFMSRAFEIITKDKKNNSVSTRITGEELLKLLEINSTKITRSLKSFPQNVELRIQLVRKTFERLSYKPTDSLEDFRTLLIQAIVANSLGEVSSSSLMLLKTIQERYYLAAQRICQDRVVKNQPRENDPLDRQREKERIVAISRAHLNIIEGDKKYLAAKLKKISETTQNKKLVVRIKDFQEWSPNIKDAIVERRKLVSNAWEMIQIMRCFPLLHQDALAFADQVRQIDPKNPLGIFLKGYIAIAEADLLVMAYRGGFKSQGKLQRIQTILKTTIKYYEQALLQVGDNYSSGNLNILTEYANAVLFMHNIGKMGNPIPRTVLGRYIKNVKSSLIGAYRETESKAIKNAIYKIELISEEMKGGHTFQTRTA